MPDPRNLRYSPVNWLIVDWGFNGQAFNDCGLPQPQEAPVPEDVEKDPCCDPMPIAEAINTYDWERWLPEVIVGIEDPDEEIAANYVREAAIEFSETSRVLQRQVTVRLQPGQRTYPVLPYDDERVVGVLRATLGFRPACSCPSTLSGSAYGVNFAFDPARQQIEILDPEGRFEACRTGQTLRILVWSAPTESACRHDVFLYEHFRRNIARGARRHYALAVHYKDRELLQSLDSEDTFSRAMAIAKVRAGTRPSHGKLPIGSGMWG